MKDREGFLFKVCCALVVCLILLGVLASQSCSSTATVEIKRGVDYVETKDC